MVLNYLATPTTYSVPRSPMAVLKKIRSRWWSPATEDYPIEPEQPVPAAVGHTL